MGQQYPYGLGSSDRIMRSGAHKARFDLHGHVIGASIGIARPMDYFDESLYDDGFEPDDPGIKARYPRAWHGEDKINVVLYFA